MNNKHKKHKKVLRIIGYTSLSIGLILNIFGIIEIARSMSGTGPSPMIILIYFGSPLIFIGIVCLVFGYMKEVKKFFKDESVPVINEASEELKPTVKNITSSIKEGLQDKNKEIVCKNCGTKNNNNSKYCSECGSNLKYTCPNCGASIEASSNFCSNCGHKVE